MRIAHHRWHRFVPVSVLALTAGFLMALAGPAGATGTVHYVAPPPALALLDTGCDFPGFNTIQAAVAASAPEGHDHRVSGRLPGAGDREQEPHPHGE